MEKLLPLRLFALIAVLVALAGCTTPATTGVKQVQRDPVLVDQAYPPAIVELNFDSYGERLNGILYQANGVGPHPTVILLHGYPGNEKNLDLAQSMRLAGYNVLFFHYRGAWGSQGNFSFSHVIEDVASAISFLRSPQEDYRVDGDRLLLVGHSMGGFAALHGAARDDAIKCVAGIAPADFGILVRAAATDAQVAKRFAAGADNLTMLNGWNAASALSDLSLNGEHFDVAALAPKLSGRSVLLIAGDQDTAVSPDVHHLPMVAAYGAQKDVKLTHTILSGDHSFSWSRFQLIDTVLEWAQDCERVN